MMTEITGGNLSYDEVHSRIKALFKAKNADYTGGDVDDELINFVNSSKMAGVTLPQGLFVRLLDKVSRISTYFRNGEYTLQEEKVTTEAEDLANYAIFLAMALSRNE